jgi:hypothetical protein
VVGLESCSLLLVEQVNLYNHAPRDPAPLERNAESRDGCLGKEYPLNSRTRAKNSSLSAGLLPVSFFLIRFKRLPVGTFALKIFLIRFKFFLVQYKISLIQFKAQSEFGLSFFLIE